MQSPQSSHKKIQIEWVENTEVGFERGECVTIRTLCYILSFLLQEIRLEPVEEEVLESKSVGFKSFFFFSFVLLRLAIPCLFAVMWWGPLRGCHRNSSVKT